MKTWFCADTHFDHIMILKYCSRPFKSVKVMNDTLVRNWNNRVGKHDLVIFLGDFAFKKRGEDNVKKWLSLLNGHIAFVRGNHDRNNSLNARITSLILNIGGKEVFCTHNPRNYRKKYPINLTAHVHEKWRIQKRNSSYLINVGVDVWNYAPVSIDEILKALAKYKRGC